MPPQASHLNGRARFANQSNGVVASADLTLTLALTAEQLDAIAERVAERLQPAPSGSSSPWLDSAGASDYLAAKPGRIHDLVALGKLTPRRDGRRLLFHRDDLDAYLEASR
jgi:excisionase family DNA binding protein